MTTLGTTRQLVALPPAIQSRLQEVRRRDSRLRLLTGLIDALSLFLVLMLAALLLDWAFTLFSTTQRQIVTYSTLVVGGLGLVVLAAIPLLKRRSLADVAADVDRSVVSLEERWQTVTELSTSEDSPRVIGSRAMIDQVVSEAVASKDLVNVHDVVPADGIKKHQWFLVLAIAANFALYLADPQLAWGLMQRFWSPTVPHSLTQIDAVSGDMVVARGEPIRLEAEAKRRPRDNAMLFVNETGSDVTNISTLTPSADDAARFTYLIDAAQNSFNYKFRSGDGETALHSVDVYDRPALTGVSFRITPPEYTRMGVIEKNELPGKIRAIAGSVLEIAFTADQPLDDFRLDFGKNQLLSLQAEPGVDANRYVYHATLTETVRFVPRLKSKHGLENVRPPSCQITVYADQPPQVRISSPDDEMAVRPDDKVTIEWNGRDDLGITKAELIVYTGDTADLENAQLLPFESGDVPPPTPNKETAPAADAAKSADDAGTQKPAEPVAPADAQPNAAAPADAQTKTTAPTESKQKSDAPSDAQPTAATPTDAKPATADPTGKSDPKAEAADSKTKQPNDAKSKSVNDPKAKDAKGTQADQPQAPSKSNPSADAANQPQDAKSTDSNNANANADANETTPPANRTFRMPLDLADKAGMKNIVAKANLDLKKLNLKNGEQVQYMIRIHDSRNAQSQGQTHSNRQETKPVTGPTAQTMPKDPASSGQKEMAMDKDRDKQGNEAASGSPTANAAPKNSDSTATDDAKAQASKLQADTAKNAAQAKMQSGDAKNASQGKNTDSAKNAAQTNNADSAKDASQTNNGDNAAANDGASKLRTSENTDSAKQAGGGGGPQKTDGNPQDPADKSQQANAGAQKGGGGSQSQQDSAKQAEQTPQDQQSQSGGSSPPPNDMEKQELDVDQSQASASSTMRLQIDEWAGSFEGQKRKKLEIKIDPVLKQLTEALTKTREHLAPVGDALKQAKPLDEELNKSIRAAQTRLEQSQSLVADLVKTTDGTVYAFIGLQLVDITELHITPALTELQGVAKDGAEKQSTHVEQTQYHVNRALELLADLTKKYETAKSDAKLAEDMDRIQKMYQTFLEESATMLGANEPGRNSRGRKMAQLELDEEFLEQYTELQKEWEKILAELAKALADDPRLLQRYMNLSRQSSQSLRDQLTIINDRQKALVPMVNQLVKDGNGPANDAKAEAEPNDAAAADATSKDAGNGDKPDAAKEEKPITTRDAVLATLARDLDVIADRANDEQENLRVWLPTGIDPQDKRITPLREQNTKIAVTAALAATSIGKQDGGASVTKTVTELGEQLKALETTMAAMVNGDNPTLDGHINRRLAKVRQMEVLTTAWLEKNEQFKAGRYNRAVELDQHKLAEDTLELVGKLDTLDAQLAGLPDDIFAISDELKEILRFDVLTDEMSAELSLRDNELSSAQEQQKTALVDLARAEAQFDKLFDRIIEEQDKVPPTVPDIDAMQLQTLEQLLAQLQNEQDLAEALGLPNRPINLQQLRAWINRNNGSSGGSGMVSGPQQGMNRVNQARRDAQRAMQRANELKRAQRPGAERRRWNTLASELENNLRQGRGNMPPKQYRRAIERYFEVISGAEAAADAPAASEQKADEPKSNEADKQ